LTSANRRPRLPGTSFRASESRGSRWPSAQPAGCARLRGDPRRPGRRRASTHWPLTRMAGEGRTSWNQMSPASPGSTEA
jgi:hypothetical protein